MDEYTKENAFEDFNYLIDNMDFFYQQYGDKYIVIQYKTCVGVFDSEEAAVVFIESNNISSNCIMRKCFKFPKYIYKIYY